MHFKRLKRILEYLIGKPSEESMEARIFHAVCILSVITLFLTVLFNYYIGLGQLSLIMLGVGIALLLFYYYSRFQRKSSVNIIIYASLSNIVFAINFYFNSGIDGPTLLIFIASLFLIVTVAPPKQFWFWVTVNILIVFILLIIQFSNGSLVKYTYPSNISRYTDIFVSYSIIVFLIFSTTRYLRHNYSIEKKAAEQKTAELEIANDTKNKLLSILAHDLRSPLDSIQSYLELLMNARLTNDEKKYIEKDLLEKTQHTGQILSNLLSWIRTQMEGVKVNLTSLNLSETLEETITLQQAIAVEKGISIKNQIKTSTHLIADKDMLQLVIRNLLNNAIKFSPVGESISISEKLVNDTVFISVTDKGIGITEDAQKDMFSLKGKSTYGTKKEKGFGLGLVLCKEFIEMQGGTIGFESDAEKGTTFFISLPILKISYKDESTNFTERKLPPYI